MHPQTPTPTPRAKSVSYARLSIARAILHLEPPSAKMLATPLYKHTVFATWTVNGEYVKSLELLREPAATKLFPFLEGAGERFSQPSFGFWINATISLTSLSAEARRISAISFELAGWLNFCRLVL